MLDFFGIGKYASYAIVALTVLSILTGGYFLWKHNVEQAARMQYNVEQLEAAVREQQEVARRQQELQTQQRALTSRLLEENRKNSERSRSINEFLNTQQTDRPASDILRETIERLQTR
jgi:uncharacterized protein HemX